MKLKAGDDDPQWVLYGGSFGIRTCRFSFVSQDRQGFLLYCSSDLLLGIIDRHDFIIGLRFHV